MSDDLISRLKTATEADCEMDCEIAVAVLGGTIDWKQTSYTMELHPVRRYKSAIHVGGLGAEPVLHYTASIDAALTLVPEDPANPGKPMLWSISYDEDGVAGERGYCAALGKGYHDPEYIYGHSVATPALALCIASLKARAHSERPR